MTRFAGIARPPPQVREARILLVKALDQRAPLGAVGVACALDILRRELRTTMALTDQTSVKNLERDLVFRVD